MRAKRAIFRYYEKASSVIGPVAAGLGVRQGEKQYDRDTGSVREGAHVHHAFQREPRAGAGGRDNPGQEKHPYINHSTGEFMTLGREPIETVVKAWTTNDATYTLQSVYDRAPVF